jgi:hypothetical protein
MLQLVYVSSVTPGIATQLPQILAVSQANNRRDGITGLLYADNRRFLQALEGPADAVRAAFARIQADPRHRAVVILSSREVTEREFGEWAMAERRPGAESEAFLARIDALTAGVGADVRATFHGLARVPRPA